MSKYHRSLNQRRLTEARAVCLNAGRQANAPCIRCGGPIDYSLDGRVPQGPTADHIPSLEQVMLSGGDPYDPRAMAPAHKSCNASAGRKTKRVVSRAWW